MRNPVHTLVLVDVQNIYYGSLKYTSGQQQIDYARLMGVIRDELLSFYKGIRPEIAPYLEVNPEYRAYVVQTPKSQGLWLFAFLRSLGYGLRFRDYEHGPEDKDKDWHGSVSNLMQMDILEYGPDFDAIVVVSGNGVFERVFKACQQNYPHVQCIIAAFDNTLHHTYTDNEWLTDHIIYLDDRVLRDRNGK